MDKKFIEELLKKVAMREISTEDALERLKNLPYKELEFAKLDNHRSIRTGYPEVVFCMGKTPAQVAEIMATLAKTSRTIMATRATEEHFQYVHKRLIEEGIDVVFYKEAKIIRAGKEPNKESYGKIAVVTAGTSDIPVAEEAAVTAEILGNSVERIYDVGVAGIHRLFDKIDEIRKANVIIVVAGMEGALASVLGGLVDKPVIAVPTSIGYGANFGGLSALLSMLNSCANGVATVNIDNGYGAGYMASTIIRSQTIQA